MDFVDTKYINSISSRLEKFKRIKDTTYNFRCPLCGDSSKNKNKSRGYLYSIRNNVNYKCHNCGSSISFSNFLKYMDSDLHKKYLLEKYSTGNHSRISKSDVESFDFKASAPKFKEKLDLPKASTVTKSKEYLENRKLDPDNFYYAKNFKQWVNSKKDTFSDIKYEEDRIIIPLYGLDKNIFGFIGRSLNSKGVKYITIILDDSYPKIYGMDKTTDDKSVYIVEGPFDSEFVSNSIAMCGADVPIEKIPFKDLVFIFDNEPRNKEICFRMEKIIDKGYKIVIWPTYIKYKDINLMAIDNIDYMSLIKNNTYYGLEAKIKFNEWKRYE